MAADKKHRDEQELERYGVWVKAGPDQLVDQDSTSLELMDIEDSGDDELLITEEEEQLLGELEESALPDFSDFDDTFNMELEDDSIGEGFDDAFAAVDTPFGGVTTEEGESRELLHKIEGDLNALRDEIRQLKEELSGLRVPSVTQAVPEPAESGGFFDEEGDETIALTGDELDNILDSAEMTEERVEVGEPETEPIEASFGDGIEIEDEETIDLSRNFTDVEPDEIDEFIMDEPEDEEDPALTILGSPEEAEEEGDPDTIEIDIPGADETVDLDDIAMEDVVLDESTGDAEAVDSAEFEEITDLDDFGLEDAATIEVPLMDHAAPEEILVESTDEIEITESFDEETFDEGEEVEIDLDGLDEDLAGIDDSEMPEMEMEEISLDDFGVEPVDVEPKSEAAPEDIVIEDDSDVLAIDDIGMEEIPAMDGDEDESESFLEDVELEEVLVDGIEEEAGLEEIEEISLEEAEEPDLPNLESEDDLEIEEIDLLADESETSEEVDILDLDEIGEDLGMEEVEIEEIDLGEPVEELDIEELPETAASGDFTELSLDDETEIIDLEDLDSAFEAGEDGEIPEIAIDDAIEEIESVEEFSIDDEELIEDLEAGVEEEDGIQVTLPDDDFNELPGTEEVDLDSLEALAAAPDLTDSEEESIIDLPDLENDADDLENLEMEELSDIEGDLEIELPEEPESLEDIGIPDEILEEPGLDETPAPTDAFPVETEEELGELTEAAFETGPAKFADQAHTALELESLPGDLKDEIKDVLKYMDQLLESLPDDKIQEFARSEHFEVYKKIFEELGITD